MKSTQHTLNEKLAWVVDKIAATRALLDVSEEKIREIVHDYASEGALQQAVHADPPGQGGQRRSVGHSDQHHDEALGQGDQGPTEEGPSGQPRSVAPNRQEDVGTARPTRTLSPRQVQMIQLMHKGIKDSEVAAQMGVKLTTVKQTKQALYRRLGVHSAIAALNQARQLGLLDPQTDDGNNVGAARESTLASAEVAGEVPEPEWPGKVKVLFHPRTGKFALATTSEEQGNVQGLACFQTDDSALLFSRYNQHAGGHVVMELSLGDAREVVRAEGMPEVSALLLLDDPASPIIRQVA